MFVGHHNASSESSSHLTVERALADMEGDLGRRAGAPTLRVLGGAPSQTQYEVLQN